VITYDIVGMSVTHLHDAREGQAEYKQVELRLWHPGCWTLRATEEHPGTHVVEKSLYPADDVIKGDFILASEEDVPIDAFVETIDGYDVVNDVAVLKQRQGRARAVVNYRRDSSIVPEIVNSDFMPIEPVHITGGEERWTVLVRTAVLGDVVAEMEEAHDVDVSAIREVDPKEALEFADVVDRIDDDLSGRQRECLLEAEENGYYSWPRELSAKDVAEDVGITHSTFLEHLRLGEQKVVVAVLEELRRRHPIR